MRTRVAGDADRRLLRRAARAVAVQTALAVAVVVLAMAGAVLLLDEHQQRRQAIQVSKQTWSRADDVDDPPAQTWLIIRSAAGQRRVTPGAPTSLTALDPATLPDGTSWIVRNGTPFVVYSGNRARLGRVSAVYSRGEVELEERRLQESLGLAALLGVLGAAAVGALIGRRAVRPLGEAMAMQRRFVADASHELRTPLSVLLLRAQLLRRHLKDSAGQQRLAELDRLVQDAKVLGDVVNDMLLSVELEHRPQAGEMVNLVALAGDVSASMKPLADERSVSLAVLLSESDSQTAYYANGAPAALRRAISSLVDNAIAHTAAGGKVRLQFGVDSQTVSVTVTDDGEGLDPDEADRLVERFSRGTADNSGRRFGLGLALVEEVARAHGGRLIVAGQPGLGASFTLRLPLPPVDATDEAGPADGVAF